MIGHDDAIDVFYGRVTNNLAQVYARAPRRDGDEGVTISGKVRGPLCRYSHTLPATLPLRDLGPGPTLLAQAVVPDPCCWSPSLPALYEVQVEVRDGERVRVTARWSLGIRRFGAARKNLILEGRRWVLRGVECDADATTDLRHWRQAAAVLVTEQPADELCREASLEGVMIVARLGESDVARQLARLSRWAAVAVAVVPGPAWESMDELQQVAPNVLLAQPVADDTPVEPRPQTDLLFCRVSSETKLAQAAARYALPIVAVRPFQKVLAVGRARRHCDRLQRDLAPHVDCAGYVV